MGALLKIVDEHFGSTNRERVAALQLRLVSERVTAREIIKQRVLAEVALLNDRKLANATGHARSRSFLIDIESNSAEAALNPPVRLRKARLLNAEQEAHRASEAFDNRQFIMLLDDRQLEGLDDELTLTSESEVVFLYLMPLRGG